MDTISQSLSESKTDPRDQSSQIATEPQESSSTTIITATTTTTTSTTTNITRSNTSPEIRSVFDEVKASVSDEEKLRKSTDERVTFPDQKTGECSTSPLTASNTPSSNNNKNTITTCSSNIISSSSNNEKDDEAPKQSPCTRIGVDSKNDQQEKSQKESQQQQMDQNKAESETSCRINDESIASGRTAEKSTEIKHPFEQDKKDKNHFNSLKPEDSLVDTSASSTPATKTTTPTITSQTSGTQSISVQPQSKIETIRSSPTTTTIEINNKIDVSPDIARGGITSSGGTKQLHQLSGASSEKETNESVNSSITQSMSITQQNNQHHHEHHQQQQDKIELSRTSLENETMPVAIEQPSQQQHLQPRLQQNTDNSASIAGRSSEPQQKPKPQSECHWKTKLESNFNLDREKYERLLAAKQKTAETITSSKMQEQQQQNQHQMTSSITAAPSTVDTCNDDAAPTTTNATNTANSESDKMTLTSSKILTTSTPSSTTPITMTSSTTRNYESNTLSGLCNYPTMEALIDNKLETVSSKMELNELSSSSSSSNSRRRPSSNETESRTQQMKIDFVASSSSSSSAIGSNTHNSRNGCTSTTSTITTTSDGINSTLSGTQPQAEQSMYHRTDLSMSSSVGQTTTTTITTTEATASNNRTSAIVVDNNNSNLMKATTIAATTNCNTHDVSGIERDTSRLKAESTKNSIKTTTSNSNDSDVVSSSDYLGSSSRLDPASKICSISEANKNSNLTDKGGCVGNSNDRIPYPSKLQHNLIHHHQQQQQQLPPPLQHPQPVQIQEPTPSRAYASSPNVYQASNQAIIASTIRHLYRQSSNDTNKEQGHGPSGFPLRPQPPSLLSHTATTKAPANNSNSSGSNTSNNTSSSYLQQYNNSCGISQPPYRSSAENTYNSLSSSSLPSSSGGGGAGTVRTQTAVSTDATNKYLSTNNNQLDLANRDNQKAAQLQQQPQHGQQHSIIASTTRYYNERARENPSMAYWNQQQVLQHQQQQQQQQLLPQKHHQQSQQQPYSYQESNIKAPATSSSSGRPVDYRQPDMSHLQTETRGRMESANPAMSNNLKMKDTSSSKSYSSEPKYNGSPLDSSNPHINNEKLYQQHPHYSAYNSSEKLYQRQNSAESSQQIYSSPRSSLYMNAPDFTKQIPQPKQSHQSGQQQSLSNNNNLSQLHMKPPDFTKLNSNSSEAANVVQYNRSSSSSSSSSVSQNSSRSNITSSCSSNIVAPASGQQMHHQHPEMQKYSNTPVNHQNFAELSKKYNYISDLRLKNPGPGSSDEHLSEQQKAHYNNLYVKAPDFSMQNFEGNRAAVERPTATDRTEKLPLASGHVNPQQRATYLVTNSSCKSTTENPYARKYPQLSDDVVMSVVSSKSAGVHPEEPTRRNSYGEYPTKSNIAQVQQYPARPGVVEPPQSLTSSSTTSQPAIKKQQAYPYRSTIEEATGSTYPSTVHLQRRDSYPKQSQQPTQIPTNDPKSQTYMSNMQDPKLEKRYPIEQQYHHQPQPPTHPQSAAYYGAAGHQYNQKLTQNQSYPSNYGREAYPDCTYSQPPASVPPPPASVIQNNTRPKENHYVDYPSQSSVQSPQQHKAHESQSRLIQSPNYYQMPQQQASPHPPPSSTYKNLSPSPTMMSRPYTNQSSIIHQAPPATAVSPACQSASSCKSTPSPGVMNPPFGWPSQSSSGRISQSPVSSPHPLPYRVTQSPVGAANAVSPHSPAFLQPSPKPSPSPTYLQRPSPQAPQPPPPNISVNYKNPYNQGVSQIPPYQEPAPRDVRIPSSFPPVKQEKSTIKHYPEQPIMQQQAQPQYRHTPDYGSPPAMMQHKQQLPSSKPMVEPIDRRCEPLKIPQKFGSNPDNMAATAAIKKMRPQEQQPPLSKYPSEVNINKANEKPNYREMINHAYAMRHATSEDDLNCQIIKRTLNKDISVRRSENDLSKSIFDSPVPTKTNSQYTKNSEVLHAKNPYEVAPGRSEPPSSSSSQSYLIPKYPAQRDFQYEYRGAPHISTAKVTNTTPEPNTERRSSLPICNDLARNDISVTVSKVIKSTTDRPKTNEKDPSMSREYSNVVISKLKPEATPEQKSIPSSSRAKDVRTEKAQQSAPPRTVVSQTLSGTPVKRESPLDLSVKTVKTKADSTGCDDQSVFGRSQGQAHALKVDFSPNFSKHANPNDYASAARATTQPIAAYRGPPAAVPPIDNKSSFAQASHARSYSHQPAIPSQPVASHYPGTPQQYPQQVPQRHPSVSQPHQHANPLPTQQSMGTESHYPTGAHRNQRDISPHHATVPHAYTQTSYQTPAAQHPTPQHHQHPSAAYQPATALPYQHPASRDSETHMSHRESKYYPPQPLNAAMPPDKGPTSHEKHYPPSHTLQRDSEMVKQAPLVLNPPTNNTVYDKKSDDYLVNTPQRYKKYNEKFRPPESDPLRKGMEERIKQAGPPPGFTNKPQPPPAPQNCYNEHYYMEQFNKQSGQQPYPYYPPRQPERKDDYVKKEPIALDHYSKQHPEALVPSAGNKPNHLQDKAKQMPPQQQQAYNYYDPQYNRKRALDPAHVKTDTYQPPEKQVRVDELYKAHLAQSYYAQHQQQQYYGNPVNHYDRREPQPISLQKSKQAPIPKESPQPNPLRTTEQYRPAHTYPQSQPPPPPPQLESNVASYHSYMKPGSDPTTHRHHQTWYPPTQADEKHIPPSQPNNFIKREPPSFPFVHPTPYNETAGPRPLPERNKNPEHNSRPNAAPHPQAHAVIEQTPATAIPKSAPPPLINHQTGLLRGADQNVISKLRNSIEMREFEKQKLMVRKQVNGEISEEDPNKPDIASILAARIRTKGELKGYTPIPPVNNKKPAPDEPEPIEPIIPTKIVTPPPLQSDPFPEIDGVSAFDLMDWGSACNDFVEQLQTGTRKKGGKRRKSHKLNPETVEDVVGTEKMNPIENLPGVEYNGDIDHSLVEQIKSEAVEASSNKESKIGSKSREASSSDEDKPLLLLRQQSFTDVTKPKSELDCQPPAGLNDVKSQDSDVSSTLKNNRSTVVEKLSEKIARNIREKQRQEQEKRLAARLSKTSSSETEDENKRIPQRHKKLTRKQRSRASNGASTRDTTDADSSGAEEDSMTRNLVRSRAESRKRKLTEKSSSESESIWQVKKLNRRITAIKSDDDESNKSKSKKTSPILESSSKPEIITKAKMKCMRLPVKSDSSDDQAEEKQPSKDESQTQQEEKLVTPTKITQKETSEDESNADQEKAGSSKPSKTRKLTPSRKSQNDIKQEETMTRSKRKKELEQQIANSKVLRNEKVVQNTSFDYIRKLKSIEKTPVKTTASSSSRNVESKSSEEKFRSNPGSAQKGFKIDKVEETKRKLCDNESDDKVKKKHGKFTKEQSASSSSDSSHQSEPETVSDRLRSRRSRTTNEGATNEPKAITRTSSKSKEKVKDDSEKKSTSKNSTPSKKTTTPSKQANTDQDANLQKFPPGWEMEVYQYKRALKIPASLITIKGPAHHRVSTSLPDLDPHSSDASESFASENAKKLAKKAEDEAANQPIPPKSKHKKGKTKKEDPPPPPPPAVEEKPIEKPPEESTPEPPKIRSIIDVLHQRVSRPTKPNKKTTKMPPTTENKTLPRGNNEAELLPTPGAKDKDVFGNNHGGHHNVFETEVLKSRTRTEYRVMKNKELIREVFGGEDRPASAPPELPNADVEVKTEHMTFDQKYQQYLQKMNTDFGEKIRKNRKPNQTTTGVAGAIVGDEPKHAASFTDIQIKTEKPDEDSISMHDEETQDTEINACMQNPVNIKEETQDTNERDTPSIASERDGVVTPLLFKRKKNNKYRSGRRKGSSGFDYIRKKKKPSPQNTNGHEIGKRKKTSPIEFLHSRDENDVSKEIQKWVLNKSVGQSALHKAARLGFLDVIAYCLERIGMGPDSKDNAGYTPLHEACAKGRIDIARVLLQYGANHSETAHSGIRPLHEATENGYIEIVRLLLSYGADPLLTTYSGQTPLMLAENNEMEQFLRNHLQDVQNTGPHKQPWKFEGSWKIYDPDECGYDVLSRAPDIGDDDEDADADDSKANKESLNETIREIKRENTSHLINDTSITATSTPIQTSKEKCDSNSNIMSACEEKLNNCLTTGDETPAIIRAKFKTLSTKCTVVLNNIESIDHINSVKQFNDCQRKSTHRRRSTVERKDVKSLCTEDESDLNGELFEFEEADVPLPPLYLLKDEGTEKWVLLNDLCNLLKVKSKDTLLKQLCPSIPPSTVNKELLRELKMSDFLERATCLQLLCAGEKLNIRSSKVVLVKYNESVRKLLGVKSVLMRF